MSEPYSHLDPSIHWVMEQSVEERLRFAEADQWVDYPAALDGLERLTDALKHTRADRMENTLIVSDSNNGKSTLLKTFAARNRGHGWMADAGGTPQSRAIPVVLMEMPRKRNEDLFWKAVLNALKCPYPRKSEDIEPFTCALLEQFEVRVLMIDELHNVLLGPPKEQRASLKQVKALSNLLRLPIIAAGTYDAEAALATDDETDKRFEPFYMPRWNLDRDFRGFVAAYERLLPLAKPSGLSERDLLIPLHTVSDGTVGRVVKLLQRAAKVAIRTGKEQIDADMILSVANLPRGKERRRQDP